MFTAVYADMGWCEILGRSPIPTPGWPPTFRNKIPGPLGYFLKNA